MNNLNILIWLDHRVHERWSSARVSICVQQVLLAPLAPIRLGAGSLHHIGSRTISSRSVQ